MQQNNILKYIFIVILLLTQNICLFGQGKIHKLRIDPPKAMGGNFSDYFESSDYVPLETTKESMFGQISKLLVTDSSIVIYDFDTRCVLFFSLDGKFITKVRGNQNTYFDLTYVLQKKSIAISSYNPYTKFTEIKYYTQKGRQTSSNSERFKNLNNIKIIPVNDQYLFEISNCNVSSKKDIKDSIFYLIRVIKNGQIYKRFLPYNPKDDLGFCYLYGYIDTEPIIDSSGTFYIATPLDHRLYRIDENKAEEIFQLVFPVEREVPKRIMDSGDWKLLDSSRRAISNSDNLIIYVNNILFKKNLLFFKLNTSTYVSSPGSDSKYQYNFIYDTLSKNLISLERMVSDQKNFYLPFSGNQLSLFGMVYSKNFFYTSISSLEMFAAREATKSRNPQYPPVLQEYFKTQNRKSNPVIVRMKLKE